MLYAAHWYGALAIIWTLLGIHFLPLVNAAQAVKLG